MASDELAAEERRFAELRALKKGWDSYESYPIQDGVEARAKAILATLRTQPFICPTGEGGICLEWRADEVDSLEIDVAPDGALSAFIEELELEDAGAPDGPLARHKRAMVIIEERGKRIAELQAELTRARPIVEAAGALVEHDRAKPALGKSITVWRVRRRLLLNALAHEARDGV